jgi:hypothetical protein
MTINEKQGVTAKTENVGNSSPKVLDFGHEMLKPTWDKLIEAKRPDAQSVLLKVTTRITKLDPIAEQALTTVKQEFSADEKELRKLITGKGLASGLDRVIKRVNNLRISENKRIVLAAVYPNLLDTLLKRDDAAKEVEDESGFTEALLFELDRAGGPLDRFSQEIVKRVGAKHRIDFPKDNVLRDLIAYQVRAGL